MHSSAIRKFFNGASATDDVASSHNSQFDGRHGPVDQTVSQRPPESLLTLAKSETLRSAQRRQLASAALAGFPVWDLALFLFENHYENRRVTPADICSEIQWSEAVTIRHLRLLEADGVVRIRSVVGESGMSVTLSAKTHAAIGDYLRNAA